MPDSRKASLRVLAVALLLATGAVSADDHLSPVDAVIGALEPRPIGPAMMGGRIADIAVHPGKPSTWYVAAGSGGVWKTVNAGTTWTPVFDEQPSYSIGEVTLDPTNPDVVWVGTGENVSGRHVAWGDGVYRSLDGGASWQNMGLEASEHIGRILVKPDDPSVVLVAAEGPLWSSGGERGIFRSTDGGENWTQALAVDDKTGATDMEFHPSDPSVVYAATYQRRRTVWSFLAGGPGSGIWKSTDGGATWREITTGLPTAQADLEVGKIGLAVTPADPDRVYATIEANDGEQGFFVSHDRGESWERRNEYISGGTGPHYYQEIEASPTDADRVYQMDVFLHITDDGGETFSLLETARDKHSDNHALWIDPSDPAHLLAGTDGGLYESFDDGLRWRHFPNLPISQLYKVAVSDHAPFPNVLVGAQDLGTLYGPVSTTNIEGVRNRDWDVPYGADGYGVAFDPFDLDTFYQMSQNGNLVRYHVPSGENTTIRPRPAPGEDPERWNWDSPVEASASKEGRIYFGSQRVWRSDDRGDSWQPISGDLTTGVNRFTLPVDGRVRSTDSLWDLGAMSRYAALTAISESAVDSSQLWTGSDDGLVHYSNDGGENWRQVTPPALPARAFINDVEASRHDADGAFVVADNHKTGDYRPLLFATTNGGRQWQDISGDLPEGVIVWAIQQDHVEPGLLYLAAENGLYVSLDSGRAWRRLPGPTIAFRDLKLQRRDDDLVGATFGRGVYVLDDIGPLRELAAQRREDGEALAEGSTRLFGVRDAWWYIPSVPGQAPGLPSQGSDEWRGPNPEMGPLFTVYLGELHKTPADLRREREKELAGEGEDIPFPGWETLRREAFAGEARYYLQIRDAGGNVVRRLSVAKEAAAQRLSWDMRGAAPDAIQFDDGGFRPPWQRDPRGPLMTPGEYSAQLLRVGPDGTQPLGTPRSFRLQALDNYPEGTDYAAAAAFQQRVGNALRRLGAVDGMLAEMEEESRYLREAIDRSPAADASLHMKVDDVVARIADLRMELRGNPARDRLSEFQRHNAADRINAAADALDTRQPPTKTQRTDLQAGETSLTDIAERTQRLRDGPFQEIKDALAAAGAPWIPGQSADAGS